MNEGDLPWIKDLPEGFVKDYRKKPVVIQAVRWNGTSYCADFLHQWSRGDVFMDGGLLRVVTEEGIVFATVGSYIVCGVAGEFYPCRPDIFEGTHEPCSSD